MIRVYSRLTLDEASVHGILPQADVQGPIQRYDVARDLADGVNLIVVIDGKFHHDLSVSCGELRDALQRGVVVYGASSMGALRASEMETQGMIGHGEIFQFIKAADCFRDDFLGQIFSHDVSRIITLPYLDVYFNLRRLLEDGRITSRVFREACRLTADLHYADRSPGVLLARSRSKSVAWALDRAVRHMGSQKRRDAIGALQRVRADLRKVEEVNARINRLPREQVLAWRAHAFGYPGVDEGLMNAKEFSV